LFDFGLYFFHNAKLTLKNGHGPYFYLPKLEAYEEAKLWDDVFVMAQEYCSIPIGTIRATVLIETISAAFQMEEILFSLRRHSAGLNCGRWDYIFSFIKKFRVHRAFVLPERGSVTMQVPFMKAYVDLLIQTCHRRKVHAMGGMAAQIPIKDNPAAHEMAMKKVYADKVREAEAGHDGTWVAHPALIPIAKEVFDQIMPESNQINKPISKINISESDLISRAGLASKGISLAGIRDNIRVSLQYMEAWLSGLGCVPINNLMEDAATAEISRSQLWQWIHHRIRVVDTGKFLNVEWVIEIIEEELKILSEAKKEKNKYPLAAMFLRKMIESKEIIEFLTILCYDEIVEYERESKL
jgi:malate synthase